MILAIDPGTEKSALVVWDGSQVIQKAILLNAHMAGLIVNPPMLGIECADWPKASLCVEMVASYGMPVGKEVFETVLWIGRFVERWEGMRKKSRLVYRRDVKLHHCGSARAKDSNIRQALIDKYGAPGTKKNPGLTYGLSKDLWSAFAIATYATETLLTPPDEKQSV